LRAQDANGPEPTTDGGVPRFVEREPGVFYTLRARF
jgi:hypothetical protein